MPLRTVQLFALALLALVALLLWSQRAGRPRLAWVFKPLAAVCFVAVGWLAGALETPWGSALFAGLVLAACGDVLLIPKDRRAFLAGLVSFLLGHVAYCAAFAMRGLDLGWTLGAGAASAMIAVPVLRWLWPHVEPKMRVPVACYVLVITAMVALAFGTWAARGDARILVGAVGFYLSDLAVARERFVRTSFNNRLWGLPLYFGAQLVLAMTPGGNAW